MRPDLVPLIFPPPVLRWIGELADVSKVPVADRFDDPAIAGLLPSVEVLVTGWDCPPVDAAVLDAMPHLRAVLHAAGSVKQHLTHEFWDRGLLVSSAADANAVPVAEYTVSAILLAGKGVFGLRERYRAARAFVPADVVDGVGNFGLRVGVVGASRIGRRVINLLRAFDVEVFLTDPHVDEAAASDLGATLVDLDKLMATCDVVSLHAPDIPDTHRMIDRDRLSLMRDGGVIINTARGALVDSGALTRELVEGRLSAVLDVTDPEPLPADSPLFDLPNVFLTPHIAGSQGNELARMGESTAAELERLVHGRPLRHAIRRSDLEWQA